MGFKLYSDSMMDMPMLACDVCGQKIIDIWSDKATGTPSQDGQLSDVTVHHASCAATGSVSMQLIDFIRLFRPGNLGSDGQLDTVHVQYPTGGRFEA
jgi:hypothetical protein